MATYEEILHWLKPDPSRLDKIAAISEFVKNPENDFQCRLDVWRSTPPHLFETESSIIHLPKYERKYGEISWFDDVFHFSRYQVVHLPECLDYNRTFGESDKAVDFATECMELGLFAFVLDW